MNRELIRKYKAEFAHYWLDEGKLQFKDKWGAWHKARNFWSLTADEIKGVVIDDEYVEFRKALTEGRTIQFNIAPDDTTSKWEDCTKADYDFNWTKKHYRIKPNFKVGD